MSVPTIYAWDLISNANTVIPGDSADRAVTEGYDLAFDHATGLFLRGPDGDLIRTFDLAAIAQSIKIMVLEFLGEWHVDKRRGTPWLERILVKSPDLGDVKSILTGRILLVPGVRALTSMTIAQNKVLRTLSVTFSVSTDVGELIDALEVPAQLEG